MRTVATLFKALSDETRLQMVGLLLRSGELCVCDFVEVLDITQSKASRHLRHLVNAGLLQDRRAGVWVYFRIAESPDPLQGALISMLQDHLPAEVPAELFQRLESWRTRLDEGGISCREVLKRQSEGGRRDR